MSSTTGMNRGRIKWDIISHVVVPEYKKGEKEVISLIEEMEKFWKNYHEFLNSKEKHKDNIIRVLDVEGENAHKRWLSYKPPE